MTDQNGLARRLHDWAGGDTVRRATAAAILGLAEAGRALAALVAEGTHGAGHGAVVGENLGGDAQKALDRDSHDIVRDALLSAGVGVFGSEEADEAEILDPAGLVAVAVDPLDGSSNIETNTTIGTIFSVLPARGGVESLLQPGTAQLAAGFIVYGPHTDLVLTLGDGTMIFTLDRTSGLWGLAVERVAIDPDSREFAINASNYRHWFPSTRAYVDDCLAGTDGPREKDFNMRWIASMVAEAMRILVRGGIFLYPRDQRRGYADGRIRLVYEANPIAFVIEQAGGAATDGAERILDLQPTGLHQRTPIVFGSTAEVAQVAFYERKPGAGRPLAAVRLSRPLQVLTRRSCRNATRSSRSRFVRVRHHVGPGDLRADLPARETSARPTSRATASTSTIARR